MAETLTFDNEQATEVLTEEEQDSLQVGEELQEAQEELLAGKYKNAEDLEQAYIELQKKLGEDTDNSKSDTEEPSTVDSDDPYADAYNDDGSVNYSKADEVYGEEISGVMQKAGLDPWSISKHFHANNGEITAEMNGQLLEAGFSQASIDSYLAGRAVEMGYNNSNVAELSDTDVNRVQNSVGGEDQYNQMVEWASSNLDQGSIQAFDDVINSGNLQMINLAVKGLKAQYLMDQGYEGTLATGKAPKSSGSVFRSQAELVAAMDDVRYDKDPAYRADVLEKLDRSDIGF